MIAVTDEKEAEKIEALAREVELLIHEEDSRKDLKEKRSVIKQTLYGGSEKLKHVVPKGKRI